MSFTRRDFVDRAFKGSVLALGFELSGATLLLTPGQARAQDVPLRHLDPTQARRLELLGETILPGAVEAGLTHFVDHQLGVDPDDSLLLAKYFQVKPPYSNFYGTGLNVAAGMSEASSGKAIEELNDAELGQLVREMSNPEAVVDGFPAFLFYLCLRSDAVDVVYGTPEGFRKLNIPYMEHILPPEGWDG